MKKVYFIRHGQSEDNVRPVYQDTSALLSEHGRRQAEFIANRTNSLILDVIISSPLQRAKETAQIISNKINKPLEFSDLFLERKKPTELYGKLHGDVEADNLAKEWKESLFNFGKKAKDGENFEEIIERGFKALELLEKRPEENILVVSHGFFLRIMAACILLEKEMNGNMLLNFESKLKMENTGVSLFTYNNNEWNVIIWNDHSHLAETK